MVRESEGTPTLKKKKWFQALYSDITIYLHKHLHDGSTLQKVKKEKKDQALFSLNIPTMIEGLWMVPLQVKREALSRQLSFGYKMRQPVAILHIAPWLTPQPPFQLKYTAVSPQTKFSSDSCILWCDPSRPASSRYFLNLHCAAKLVLASIYYLIAFFSDAMENCCFLLTFREKYKKSRVEP